MQSISGLPLTHETNVINYELAACILAGESDIQRTRLASPVYRKVYERRSYSSGRSSPLYTNCWPPKEISRVQFLSSKTASESWEKV